MNRRANPIGRLNATGLRGVRSKKIAPIKTQRDHDRALAEIEGLMDARRGTRRGERLDALVASVEAWEARRFLLGSIRARGWRCG